MNPLQTLEDLYNQIAEIKLWICEQNEQTKNKITSFPIFTLDGLNQGFELENNQEFANRINDSLSDLFYFHAVKDNHEYFTFRANEQIIVFSRLVNLDLPEQTIYFYLISCLLSLSQIPFLSSVSFPISLGNFQGTTEIDLSKNVKYISLEITDYPYWVHRQFFYLPIPETTITEGIKAFFWSSKFNGFLEYKTPILSTKTALTKPEHADKLIVYALQDIKFNVTLWYQ